MATKKRKTTTRRAASRKKRAEQRLPAGLGTLFAGLLLVVLAFVEGDSAWKALHDVLFGLFGCGSFVLGAAVCCLAVQYTRGEDLLPKIFKLVLGLVFACGTVIVFSDIQPQGMSAFQMTAACYANGVNAWIGGGALGALLGGSLLLLCGRPAATLIMIVLALRLAACTQRVRPWRSRAQPAALNVPLPARQKPRLRKTTTKQKMNTGMRKMPKRRWKLRLSASVCRTG